MDEYYDRLAPGYDELYGEEQSRKLDIIMARLAREELDGAVLDVGCGTGASLDRLAEASGVPCVGVEPSAGMASLYRGGQELISGRAEELPFPDGYFSAVVSVTAVQNFSDVSLGISEMVRVLRRGGPLLVSCLWRSGGKVRAVAEALADLVVVEAVVGEGNDLLFCCRRV
ncbi:methyltransferase domain-containing protein [Candidatus Woesearchaeota archaeon]|nr:methyltransferase domain-containing protein [Candidatus Woesearchaeota archaeon]